jgi:hypothetical protein
VDAAAEGQMRKAEVPEKTRNKPPDIYAKQDSKEWAFKRGDSKSQRAWERSPQQTPPPPQPETRGAMADANADAFAAIDEAIRRMEKANIAFNAPTALNRDATVMIHLLLGMNQGTGALYELVEGKGETKTAIVPVTQIMQAHLSGPNFQVTPITPEEQPVSRHEKTEWKWNVRPTAVGEQALNLALNAVVTAGGNERKMTVRTFDHVILVEVTAGQQLTDFFSGNWQWLWAAFAVPIVGAVWQKKHKKTNVRRR